MINPYFLTYYIIFKQKQQKQRNVKTTTQCETFASLLHKSLLHKEIQKGNSQKGNQHLKSTNQDASTEVNRSLDDRHNK